MADAVVDPDGDRSRAGGQRKHHDCTPAALRRRVQRQPGAPPDPAVRAQPFGEEREPRRAVRPDEPERGVARDGLGVENTAREPSSATRSVPVTGDRAATGGRGRRPRAARPRRRAPRCGHRAAPRGSPSRSRTPVSSHGSARSRASAGGGRPRRRRRRPSSAASRPARRRRAPTGSGRRRGRPRTRRPSTSARRPAPSGPPAPARADQPGEDGGRGDEGDGEARGADAQPALHPAD